MKKPKLNPKVFLEAAAIISDSNDIKSPFCCDCINYILSDNDDSYRFGDESDEMDFFKYMYNKAGFSWWGDVSEESLHDNYGCRVIALLLCYEITK